MATFTYLPDWGASPELDPGVRSVRFGDGYEQRATNGLNPILPLWKLQFTRRTQAQAQAIYSWMIANNAQVTAFDWAPPGENTVSEEQFGTGDGVRLVWSLLAQSRPCNYTGTPIIYRTDWQGTQQLYPTARTNSMTRSEPTIAQVSTKSGTVTDVAAFSPFTGNSVHFPVAAQLDYAYCACSTGIINPVISVFVKMDDGSAPNPQPSTVTGDMRLLVNNGSNAADVSLTVASIGGGVYRVSGKWVGTTSVGMAGVVRYVGQSGKGFSVVGFQIEPDNGTGLPTSYTKTSGAPATVTDYTLSPSGLVTLAVAPLSGATLSWTGSYTRKHVAKFGVPKPDAYNSWSISAEFREVPA